MSQGLSVETTDRGISQTVVAGAQAPAVFTAFLIVNALFLGLMLGVGAWIIHDVGRLSTEVRIMQIHVQDQSAILIKKGLKTPEDDETGPTSGTHE